MSLGNRKPANIKGPGEPASDKEQSVKHVPWWPIDERAHVVDLVRAGGIEFSGVDVLRLRGPVVYLVTRGDASLYVGMSRNGLTRPFDRRHHALDGLHEDDRLQVWPVVSVAAAHELERLLIVALKPAWNHNGRLPLAGARILGVTARRLREMR